MQNESQNIEYKESWGRGFKKIAEEFERASLPLPTIEENGDGVMAIVQRKTIDEVIAERDGNVGVNVGDMSEINVGDVSEIKLSDRQQIIVSIIRSNPTVSAKQMSETSRTIERDCQGYKRSFKDFYWLIFLESKTFYTLTIYPNTSKFTKSNYSKACCLHSCSSNVLN